MQDSKVVISMNFMIKKKEKEIWTLSPGSAIDKLEKLGQGSHQEIRIIVGVVRKESDVYTEIITVFGMW